MINYIILSEESKKEFQMPVSYSHIGEFGKVNVFVGKNNSGKSRFLRNMIDSEKNHVINYENNEKEVNQLKNIIVSSLTKLNKQFSNFTEFTISNRKLIDKIKNYSASSHNHDFFQFLGSFMKFPEGKNEFDVPTVETNSFEIQIKNIQKAVNTLILGINPTYFFSNSYYIPILRGLRPIHTDNNTSFSNKDVYYYRTVKDYKFNSRNVGNKIFTGLSIYDEVKKMLLGGEEERKLISEFEEFLKNEIFNKRVTLIPKHDSDVLHIKLGDDPQIPIYDLGDGLQTIITILFPVFINKNKEKYFFIEEPETHLHPAWQIKLLTTLKKDEFNKHQFFLTTHSTAFINDPDSNIFSIEKEKEKIIIKEANKVVKQKLINDLGYKPSDLMLSNYVIWVEGPSDKNYLKYWIEKTGESLVEGLHYSIMILGGDNYRHLTSSNQEFDFSLLKSLNPNFGIILDSDKKRKGDELDANKIKLKENFDKEDLFCWITEKREIENYIPLEVFKNAVKDFHIKTDVIISNGDYINRCKPREKETKNYKRNIKLSSKLFNTIKENGGKTKGINAKDLRQEIEDSIVENDTFNIKKVQVSKKAIEQGFEIEDEELMEQLEKLIDKIKEANQVETK